MSDVKLIEEAREWLADWAALDDAVVQKPESLIRRLVDALEASRETADFIRGYNEGFDDGVEEGTP